MELLTQDDKVWMQHALSLAETAANHNEVPVGAVLVLNDEVIGEGWNKTISHCDPSAHAEMIAIRAAAKKINNHRILNATLYVTLEPCMMCIGALVQARIQRVVFGASDPRFGAVTHAMQMIENQKFNHCVEFQGGVLAEMCGKLLSDFFRSRR